MRLSLLLLVSTLAWAQAPDPAAAAYLALQGKQYDNAIRFFLLGIDAAPARAAIRKDLAYTYLKVGENEAARDQFAAAIRIDPADFHAALEFAFLCHETQMQAEARRAFHPVRVAGDAVSRATAEQAFQNIDRPLAAGIERWTKALELAPDNFSAHYELAVLAEQRDELELAAQHYRAAWETFHGRKQAVLELAPVGEDVTRA